MVMREIRFLSPNYRKFWTAHAISSLGNGIRLSALPLLIATLTRDPLLVAGLSTANFLPWLLFGLTFGALVDRLDRRLAMATIDICRMLVMIVLGLLVFTRSVDHASLYLIAFGLGVGEIIFGNAAQALIPATVSKQDLASANGFLYAAEVVTNKFIGPAVGGLLFALAAWSPFVVDAASFGFSAALIFFIRGQFRPRHSHATSVHSLLFEIGEALKWLWGHRLLRTFALILGAINLLQMAWFAIFVLYAQEILHLNDGAYGFLLAAGSIGSFVGSISAWRISQRLGISQSLVLVLLTLALTCLAMGLSSQTIVVGAVWIANSFAEMVWVVITVSLRQAIVPDRLLGRVTSVYRLLGWGAIPLGAVLGGFLGRAVGLRSPFFVSALSFLTISLVAIPVLSGATKVVQEHSP